MIVMSIMNSILAAILCATAPLSSFGEVSPKTEEVSNFKLGREIVSQVRSDYENGKYNEFLAEMDESYRKADLKEFIQMRSKGVPEDFQQTWEKRFSDLQKQKNLALSNAVSDDDNSVFSEKVRSLSANLTPEQEKALSKLNSFISMMPNTGRNADENKLIDIDMEYEYKLLEADNTQERQIALRMEKMDKMVEASKNFEDQSLKQAVGIAAATLDVRLARNLDGADLNRMAKQNRANSEQEKTVFAIMKEYQGQFSNLMKELR